jgi:hypothetical protein
MLNNPRVIYQGAYIYISHNGWWCKNHLEKYDGVKVNGKDDIP